MGGENIHRREKIEAVALEAILKLHKPPPLKFRPVGRGHAGQMKAWEKLVASFLVVVLEEKERKTQRESKRHTRHESHLLPSISIHEEADLTGARGKRKPRSRRVPTGLDQSYADRRPLPFHDAPLP